MGQTTMRGRDLVKDVVVAPTVKGLLKPGDVIEVAVKRSEREPSILTWSKHRWSKAR